MLPAVNDRRIEDAPARRAATSARRWSSSRANRTAARQAPLASRRAASQAPRRPAPRPSIRIKYVAESSSEPAKMSNVPLARQRRVEEMLAVGQKRREAVTGFLARRIERRHRRRRAAAGGDLEQWTAGVGRIDDDAIRAPGAAAPARRVGQGLRAPAGRCDRLQLRRVKKPMRRLSGDQNGKWPPSPPRAAAPSSSRAIAPTTRSPSSRPSRQRKRPSAVGRDRHVESG